MKISNKKKCFLKPPNGTGSLHHIAWTGFEHSGRRFMFFLQSILMCLGNKLDKNLTCILSNISFFLFSSFYFVLSHLTLWDPLQSILYIY